MGNETAHDTDNISIKPTTIPACEAKTICLVGQRQREPEVIGAMHDADTETCSKK
jgi:hypothetical protein